MRRFSIVLLFLALVSAVAAGGAGAQGYVVVLKSGANPSDVAAEHAQRLGVDVGFIYRHSLKGYSARRAGRRARGSA